ncbi:MAG: hypothetical protein OEY67_04980 [Gammaproteobacteria bacterium]|nr:hypothetical protein [Gammaproteobacteria bacterium]
MASIQQTILEKKEALAAAIDAPMADLARQCAQVWPDADALDHILQHGIGGVPNCHLLYAWDVNGIEISSLVTGTTLDKSWRGKDLSRRPYLKNHLPFKGIMLSSVYLSEPTKQLCVTALQAVSHKQTLMGFIAADFAVNDIVHDSLLTIPETRWQQFRGDPAVRGTVFMQQRATSLLDEHIDEVNDLIENLMCEHGVFHSKIHYSSGRCSIWLLDDPYNYRILSVEEIINPDICLAYPLHPYPKDAKTTPSQIRDVLEEFKALRFADETIYLRSSSLNIMNGMLGLTFSCDGSHYMPIQEFLDKDLSFWLGSLTKQ